MTDGGADMSFRFGRDALSPCARYDAEAGGRLTIYTLASGRAHVDADGRIRDLPAGYSVVVRSAGRHAYLPHAGSGHVVSWCEATADDCPDWVERGIDLLSRPFRTHERARALHALGEQACGRAGSYSAELSRHLGFALLSEFLASLTQPAPSPRATGLVERVQAILLADIARHWTVAEVAAATGLPVKRLTRRIRTETGDGVIDLLWLLRLSRGISLLTDSELQVQAIADRCGFQSPYHFSRKVKERTGLAPTALRDWAARATPRERLDIAQQISALPEPQALGQRGAVLAREAVAREAHFHA